MKYPERGLVFWPVETGDSTTIIIDKDNWMQIDIHQLEKSKDENEDSFAIVDRLVEVLPKKNGKPYLAIFALTHPDKDHIKGFGELLEKVCIGEIWQTPAIFKEHYKNLCDDAEIFKREVLRRVEKVSQKKEDIDKIDDGDRIRLIGHSSVFEKEKYKDFPEIWRSFPGELIKFNNEIFKESIKVFIHAPFKDEEDEERNNVSLSIFISLINEEKKCNALFFADRNYETVKKIFEKTEEKENTDYLYWDILLAPHHCSKKVMFVKENEEDEEVFKEDIMNYFEKYSKENSYLIVSAKSDFSDDVGKNPPHLKARKKYEEIMKANYFICTHEHPNKENIQPIVFELSEEGCKYISPEKEEIEEESELAKTVKKARGENEPQTEKVGFGL